MQLLSNNRRDDYYGRNVFAAFIRGGLHVSKSQRSAVIDYDTRTVLYCMYCITLKNAFARCFDVFVQNQNPILIFNFYI